MASTPAVIMTARPRFALSRRCAASIVRRSSMEGSPACSRASYFAFWRKTASTLMRSRASRLRLSRVGFFAAPAPAGTVLNVGAVVDGPEEPEGALAGFASDLGRSPRRRGAEFPFEMAPLASPDADDTKPATLVGKSVGGLLVAAPTTIGSSVKKWL